jgi:hypothetical protein
MDDRCGGRGGFADPTSPNGGRYIPCPDCGMDTDRADRCGAWLASLARWAGPSRPAALACEVVRGIVDVDEPEYAAGLAWAGAEPSPRDWERALELYGPLGLTVATRSERAERAAESARARDRFAVRRAVR